MRDFRIGLIGGFGHYVEPFQEWASMEGPRLVGYAPGFDGEDLGAVGGHPFTGETARLYRSVEELLKTDPPELLVVSTRLDRITDICEQGARAGCQLLCEKPLALDLPSLDRLESVLKETGVGVSCMFSMRNDPVFFQARQMARQGVIGDLVVANGRKTYKWGPNRPEWFADRSLYGGTLPWVGIHAFDMIQYISGAHFATVAAMQSNRFHPERPDCEDSCVAIARTTEGAHCTVTVDYHRPSPAPGHGDDWVRLVGTKGELKASSNDKTLRIIDADGERRVAVDAPPPAIYKRLVESLAEGREEELLPSADCLHLTRTTLRARDAADAATFLDI